MTPQALFLPMAVLALHTLAVLIALGIRRGSALKAQQISLLRPATRSDAQRIFGALQAHSDNVLNLFEVPTIFYAVVLAIAQLQYTDALFVGLAWAFVIFRIIHTIIHCTVNIVAYRFAAFLAATTIVAIMWVRVAIQLGQSL